MARGETIRDLLSGPGRNAAPPEEVRDAVLGWLAAAQDHSRSADGGFARDYSLREGWATSYPETTGYIIPTLLTLGEQLARPDLIDRSRRALDWLVAIQFPEGGFQGGRVEQTPRVPVTFNTGQILMGLAAGASRWPEQYLEPMVRAASWLRDTQDADGAWRKHPTPFAAAGDKVYETHVAWGLMDADRVAPGQGFGDAALRNLRWAMSRQEPNGWFRDCCLEEPTAPLTHTIGYALRGLVAGWEHFGDTEVLAAAHRTAQGLLGAVRADGALPGRLDREWRAAVRWSCLTGNVQIAESWYRLARTAGAHPEYSTAADAAVAYVRRTIDLTGPVGRRGGVKGSFPVSGEYGTWQYLNWAAKFYLDAELGVT